MTYTAAASCPYDDAERATRALRAHLRIVMPADRMPDWESLEVTGSEVETDAGGRTWFTYSRTVEGR